MNDESTSVSKIVSEFNEKISAREEVKEQFKKNKKISVGMIDCAAVQSSNIAENVNNLKVELNDKYIEPEVGQLSEPLKMEVDPVPHEMSDKLDNCFNKMVETSTSPDLVENSSRNVSINISTLNADANNNKRKYHMRGTFANSMLITSSNKGKMMLTTVKERKEYEDKINLLNNRIKKLKDQEDEMKKKAIRMKSAVEREIKIKSEKMELKKEINKTKKEMTKKAEKQKKQVLNEKQKRVEKLEKTKLDVLSKNKKQFDLARNDKLLIDSMLTQFNTHVSNVNNYRYVKAKQESIESKAQRFKKQTEREEQNKINFETKIEKESVGKELLKRKLRELEEVEEQCMQSLKKTMKTTSQEMGQLSVAKKLNFNSLNTSMHEFDSGINLKEATRNNTTKHHRAKSTKIVVNLNKNKYNSNKLVTSKKKGPFYKL